MSSSKAKLDRSLSLPVLTLYGIGTILGAGIYVLVGKVAGISGVYAPFTFCFAAIIALFTAMSYAELSSKFPETSGEFIYIYKAFKSVKIARVIAGLVMLTGIVSAATMANGFVGYFNVFFAINQSIAIICFICALGFIAIVGIKESALLVVVFALVEICGLGFIIYISKYNIVGVSDNFFKFIPKLDFAIWNTIFLGAFLAFFAFIGFEDMVNVAEEVKDPKNNMPTAIIIALIVTSFLYSLIALAMITSLPIEIAREAAAPMAELVSFYGYSPKIISAISIFSISNGVVVQIVMASRILFGMARRGATFLIFSTLNHNTQTPVNATCFVILVIIIFALLLPLEMLAKITSAIILIVFAMVNFSLFIIKKKSESYLVKKKDSVEYNILVPILGGTLALLLLVFQLYSLV